MALKLFGAQRHTHVMSAVLDEGLALFAGLNAIPKRNRRGVDFITLRRRGCGLLRQIAATPPSAWRRIELEGVSRLYKTPRILDREITLPHYRGPVRQLTILDLGHEQPTLLLTNQRRRSAAHLIERYARRMLIENNIEDAVNFFHIDALSSAVAMKVNCDLQLTLMASSLYRHLAQRIGNGYETAKSQHLFRHFVDATARVTIGRADIVVKFQRRAHNRLLVAAGSLIRTPPFPGWAGNDCVCFSGSDAPWC